MWPFGRRDVPLGRRGEKLAARELQRQGLKILARNYRCPMGEIDLIALGRSTRANGAETLVFAEVKTRSSDRYTDPESAVTPDKQRRIRRTAEYYVQRRDAQEFNIRFDVIAVIIRDDRREIRHIPDAF